MNMKPVNAGFFVEKDNLVELIKLLYKYVYLYVQKLKENI